jgi:hypothetical protein
LEYLLRSFFIAVLQSVFTNPQRYPHKQHPHLKTYFLSQITPLLGYKSPHRR